MFESDIDWTNRDETLRKLITQHGRTLPKGTLRDLAREFGVNRHQIRRRIDRLVLLSESKQKAGQEIQADVSEDVDRNTRFEIIKTGIHVRTLEEAVAKCQADMDVWRVKRWGCSSWTTAMKIRAGGSPKANDQVVAHGNWYIWVEFERRTPNDTAAARAAVLEEISDLLERRGPLPVPSLSQANDLVYEMNLPDLHFGKYVWGEQCGAPYNLNITRDLCLFAVSDLLKRVEHLGTFSEIWLPIGNDLLHIDNSLYTTTKGTQMQSSGYWKEIFRTAWRTLLQIITEMLRPRARVVRLIIVPGNHDRTLSWCLGELLSAVFENDPCVVVENSPHPRKYVQWGVTGKMYSHGDESKTSTAALGQLFNKEAPEIFRETRYHEVGCGHIHRRKKDGSREESLILSQADVEVEFFPSLVALDDFLTSLGAVAGVREARGIVYDKGRGRVLEPVSRPPRRLTHPDERP